MSFMDRVKFITDGQNGWEIQIDGRTVYEALYVHGMMIVDEEGILEMIEKALIHYRADAMKAVVAQLNAAIGPNDYEQGPDDTERGFHAAVMQVKDSGGKIPCIKLIRRLANLGLAEAKAYYEYLFDGRTLSQDEVGRVAKQIDRAQVRAHLAAEPVVARPETDVERLKMMFPMYACLSPAGALTRDARVTS